MQLISKWIFMTVRFDRLNVIDACFIFTRLICKSKERKKCASCEFQAAKRFGPLNQPLFCKFNFISWSLDFIDRLFYFLCSRAQSLWTKNVSWELKFKSFVQSEWSFAAYKWTQLLLHNRSFHCWSDLFSYCSI